MAFSLELAFGKKQGRKYGSNFFYKKCCKIRTCDLPDFQSGRQDFEIKKPPHF